MVHQLGMAKSLAISNLRASGLSERKIAEALRVSRNAVRRHLAAEISNDTKAQTGSAQTGDPSSNDTKAQTGSVDESTITAKGTSRSQCEPYREVIVAKLERGLSSQRIFQDLVEEHDYAGKYWSVYRYVHKLGHATPLPFRRMEVEPGAEMQVDFGAGARTTNSQGKPGRTHIFRAVLSHSRKGYTEAVRRLTTESFIRSLENAFWRLGGVPEIVIFDNAKCAVLKADWYDPELHPKVVDFSKHCGFTLLPTRPAIPRELYQFELQMFYRRTIHDGLSAMAIFSPSIRSDLTTDDAAFRVFALGLLNWEYIPDRLTLSGGAVYLGRADLPVLPAVGLTWTPTLRTKLDLQFPTSRLSLRLAKDGGNSEIWAYLSGGLGGNTWAVTRNSGETDLLSLKLYDLKLGLEENFDGGGKWFVESGLAVGRRMEYERASSEMKLGNALFLQGGWSY